MSLGYSGIEVCALGSANKHLGDCFGIATFEKSLSTCKHMQECLVQSR